MPEPTREQIDALVGPATPHFAYQLRARVQELVLDLPEDDELAPIAGRGEEVRVRQKQELTTEKQRHREDRKKLS